MTGVDVDRRALEDLLGLAIAEPAQAEVRAREVIASSTDPRELSIARHALGIALRERGQTALGIAELRSALALARRSSDPDREADVRATLGNTLALVGRTDAGLEQFRRAVGSATDPTLRAKILMRRGHFLYFYLSRAADALADLDGALAALRRADEPVWLARTLNLAGLAHLALGRGDDAERCVREAEAIFRTEGQVVESIITLHNRGGIAFCNGDIPLALRLYDEAADRFAVLDREPAEFVFDRCGALLAAGLATEAVDLVRTRLDDGALTPVEQADLMLRLAGAELASQDPGSSLSSARRALTLFRRQHRDFWAVRAELAVLLALQQSSRSTKQLAEGAISVAERTNTDDPEDMSVAWLVAGQLALRARLPTAPALLDRAAAYRTHSSDLVRATGWRARALLRESEGDRRSVLAACRRGLDALDSHRAMLGSSELRALATRHGDELSALALRHAVRSGPRTLLEWSERRRATALFQPPVHPPDDEELARELAALRDTRRRLTDARAEASPTVARLDGERTRLEAAIRRRAHHLAGESVDVERFDVGRLLAALDGATFVELVDVDGVLHALVASGNRVRHLALGEAAEADQAVAFARFALRQAARGRPSDLGDVGRRLQAALLGDAARRVGDGPVVISPTSRLHATPWGLLPALADVPFTVAPSAALWLRARAAGTPSGARVLIAGPGLESGGSEIALLSERHPEAVVLRDGTATVERSLAALDGASVAHIAAHGRFRDDSPMFSSLELDDGPITVHDLERLDRAPNRLVLSACESGVVAPIGAGEMLGLTSAMLSMGTAGIVSSVAPVNDAATAVLMLDVHRGFDDGDDLGSVLLRARRQSRGDAVRGATAAAFLAMGA